MNKVFLLSPDEDWIVDRFVKEWNDDNADVSVSDPREADVIWLLADWCWTRLPMSFLRTKKVITSVHHIVPEKFGKQQVEEFLMRDSVTTAYHVYNSQTEDFVKKLSNKPVHLIKYWANQKVWRKTGDKFDLRRKLGLPIEGYLVGSFQRDTEGHDLRSPKLEKGPDLLCDYLEKIKSESLHVVLAGWRRQYVMSRLKKSQIPYTYFERPSHETVNELYQCLDLYPVAARCEGGPQSLIECGLLGVPVVSRDVGIASQVLSRESISSDLVDALPSVPDVESWKLPRGYEVYRRLIQEV